MQIQLPADILAMRLHGIYAQAQTRGDLFIRPPLGRQLEHLALAFGQQVPAVLAARPLQARDVILPQHILHLRTEPGASRVGRANGCDQLRLVAGGNPGRAGRFVAVKIIE